ncbi:MAG TPA: hypothetical protein VGS27_36020 [Candidatus Sulfotelmatobacter sp.]|nr:hypothetical protein [Candidatus Sulfotelmatobacter sp.]
MSSYDNPGPRISAVQLNSELQQVQLELLNAHCAVHQLRLQYSCDDLARFGRRDLIRKSAETASALQEFYIDVERKILTTVSEAPPPPTPEQIAQAVGWLAQYLQEQRNHYFPVGSTLSPHMKASMWPYFSSSLLDEVRVIELHGARVTVPPFFSDVRAAGFEPPEITHMDSVTFLDLIAFNQELSERALFHALVHSVQIRKLGLQRYAELWVHSFVKGRTHFTVPLEVHAFSMASKFLRPAPERFSVEEQVDLWIHNERY